MWFQSELYIDLGTASTVVCHKKHGMIINEPSVLTLHTQGLRRNDAYAVGTQAKSMTERTPTALSVVKPLERGVIVNIEHTEKMLKGFVEKMGGRRAMRYSDVIISLPRVVTQFESSAVAEVVRQLGASHIHLLDEPIAAALGAQLPIMGHSVGMIIDIGAGTTEVAAIAMGGILYANAVRIGGDDMDQSIIQWLQDHRSFLIGTPTAERLKIALGDAYLSDRRVEYEVKGINRLTRLPGKIRVSNEEIHKALEPIITKIVAVARDSFVKLPPEAVGDIATNGILVAGGGALIQGMDRKLTEELGVQVRRCDNALFAIARGGNMLLHTPKLKEMVCTRVHARR
jgi:rod shape-determining protein MreB